MPPKSDGGIKQFSLFSGKSLEIPERLKSQPIATAATASASSSSSSILNRPKSISDVIDVAGNGSNPPVRKRKAALEQGNVLKKIKNKQF